MSREDLIDYLMSEIPQINEAFNFTEEVKNPLRREEIIADWTEDDLYMAERAAGVLEEWVYNEVTRFVKDLSSEIDQYERYAIR